MVTKFLALSPSSSFLDRHGWDSSEQMCSPGSEEGAVKAQELSPLLVENLLKEPFSILFHEVQKMLPSHKSILNSVGSSQTHSEAHSRATPAELAQSSVSWVSTATPVTASSLLSWLLRNYLSSPGVTMGTRKGKDEAENLAENFKVLISTKF